MDTVRHIGAICRDCLGETANVSARRCAYCGSPRLLAHPERDELHIAHIDCDAFYASVEKRDNPALADKPVIVGGGKRGVVSTCCYIARTYGVRSAMPMFQALKACPQAVVISPNMDKYAHVGRQVRALMQSLTPLVEPISIDEAFLDLAGTQALHQASPALSLVRMAHKIEQEIGISVSVGLSYCKFLAKIASDFDKPRGFSILGRKDAVEFLSRQSVGLIFGVGKVAQDKLNRDGFRLIGDVQRADPAQLVRLYGDEGRRLYRLAHGEDLRKVTPERETKSVSAETTFFEDISAHDQLLPVVLRLSERVSARLKKAGLSGRTVTLKLRSADFKLHTRAKTLHEPTQLSGRIFAAAREALALEPEKPYRLIGVGLSDLHSASEADHGDLADVTLPREKATEAAMDKLRARFGEGAVIKGWGFKG